MSKFNQILSWAGLMSTVAMPIGALMEWEHVSDAMEAFDAAAEQAAVDLAENSEFIDAEMRDIITTIDNNVPEGNVLEQAFEATFEEARRQNVFSYNLQNEEINNAISDVNINLMESEKIGLSDAQIETFENADKAALIDSILDNSSIEDIVDERSLDFHDIKGELVNKILVDYNLGGAAIGAIVGAIKPTNNISEIEHLGKQNAYSINSISK